MATTHATENGNVTNHEEGETDIEAELTSSFLHPKPVSMEDTFSSAYHSMLLDNSGGSNHYQQQQQQQSLQQPSHQQTRPLHLPHPDDPTASLTNKFNQVQYQYQHQQQPELIPLLPLAPLLPRPASEIADSLSSKGTTDDLLLSSRTEGSAAATQQEVAAQKRQLALEQSLNSAAAFFGINVESAFLPPPQEQLPRTVTESPPTTTFSSAHTSNSNSRDDLMAQLPSNFSKGAPNAAAKATTRSAPIKVQKMKDASANSFDPQAIHRRSSAPCVYGSASPDQNILGTVGSFSASRSQPADYIDPKDRHLWRAKYCVLEEGVLYFYRTKDDAEAQEAKLERKSSLADFGNTNGSSTNGNSNEGDGFNQGASKRTQVADLSKSPMASRSCLILPSIDGGSFSNSGGSNSNSDAESTFMWEKRVALNCVGAVRSAETEYGKNAFELLAVDDDEDEGHTNKLVLKAPKQEEMNEWIFQFHRSLASFVMNMVDLVGGATAPSYALGDIHHPGFGQNGFGQHSIQTPLRSFNVPAFSPRFVRKTPGPSVPSLSHGHGRSQRRRRPDFIGTNLSSGGSVHSVPTTPATQSPTQLPFPLFNMAATSHLVTPLKHGDLHLPEPAVLRSHQQRRREMEDRSPELSAPQSATPETERPPVPPAITGGKYVPPHLRKSGGKYVPPHLRNKDKDGDAGNSAPSKYLPPHLRNASNSVTESSSNVTSNIIRPRTLSPSEKERVESSFAPKTSNMAVPKDEATFRLGGCADPLVIEGSILDQQYIAKKASRVGRVHTDAYGSLGGRKASATGADGDQSASKSGNLSLSLEWEIGAVSECGVRDSNEDAYFVTNDLVSSFTGMIPGTLVPTYWDGASDHQSGLFAIFDGHCGNQAARFAAERLPHFLYEESRVTDGAIHPTLTEEIMRQAMQKLDEAFCRVCVEDGREWESGSTALVAMLANEHLVIASIGDCRGVLCRTFVEGNDQPTKLDREKWNELISDHDGPTGPRCFWREVADVHSPSRQDEKERIEKAGGWTTTETEIPISQLQRMDFLDQDVVDILRRCFQDRINDSQGSKACSSAPQRILQISRVCGELAVSRAIGDRDFKAACNMPLSADVENDAWETSLFLPYPDEHDRQFVGDLVSGTPDFQAIRVGEAGIQGEFLLLACDGLWDVMDMDDAVRVTQDLLFKKKCPAKQAVSFRRIVLARRKFARTILTLLFLSFCHKGRTSRRACYSLGFF